MVGGLIWRVWKRLRGMGVPKFGNQAGVWSAVQLTCAATYRMPCALNIRSLQGCDSNAFWERQQRACVCQQSPLTHASPRPLRGKALMSFWQQE